MSLLQSTDQDGNPVNETFYEKIEFRECESLNEHVYANVEEAQEVCTMTEECGGVTVDALAIKLCKKNRPLTQRVLLETHETAGGNVSDAIGAKRYCLTASDNSVTAMACPNTGTVCALEVMVYSQTDFNGEIAFHHQAQPIRVSCLHTSLRSNPAQLAKLDAALLNS